MQDLVFKLMDNWNRVWSILEENGKDTNVG